MDWKFLAYITLFIIMGYLLCSDHNPSTCEYASRRNKKLCIYDHCIYFGRNERYQCIYDKFCALSYAQVVLLIVVIYVIGILYMQKS